jgi:hypothetical protein
MFKKLFLSALLALSIPVLASLNVHRNRAVNSVAIAGHTGSGQWCQDGTPGCFPDLIGVSRRANPSPAPTRSNPSGPISLMAALVVLVLMIRALR